MHTFCANLDDDDRYILTCGYSRNNCNSTIPRVIIDIILNYNDLFIWDLQIDRLLHNACIKNSIARNNIEFECIIYPRGQLSSNTIEFHLKPKQFIYHNIVVNYEIFCKQINFRYKGVITFRNEHASARKINQQWQFIDWNKYLLCFDKLTFELQLSVLRIQKQYDVALDPFNGRIKIQKHAQFTWNINELLLKQIQAGELEQYFYSPNIGRFGNWCLFIVDRKTFDGQIEMGVTLLKKPFEIHSVKAQVELEFVIDAVENNVNNHKWINQDWTKTSKFWYGLDNLGRIFRNSIPKSAFSLLKGSMIIKINIWILEIRNNQNKLVHFPDWREYNVFVE